MVFAAGTLRDTLESNWSLSGRLLKAGSETDAMKETVEFFGHPQLRRAGEFTKAVEVKKINTPAIENETSHPRFREINDRFIITCRYRVLGGDEELYEQAESDIEDMTEEVRRIIKTVYDPTSGTGTFHTTNWNWAINDNMDTGPELRRVLNLTLTQIVSDQNTVFRGFNGVLSFDDSASTGDTKRSSDYTYTEAYNVDMNEGYTISSKTTRNSSPNSVFSKTKFSGTFRAEMFAKKADFTDANIDQLDNIYKAQNNGELASVVFLHAIQDTEATPATLTTTTKFMPTNIRKTTTDEDLIRYFITGTILAPSTVALT